MLDLDGLDGVHEDRSEPLPLPEPPRPERNRVITPPPLPDDAPTGVEVVSAVTSLKPRTPWVLWVAPIVAVAGVVGWISGARTQPASGDAPRPAASAPRPPVALQPMAPKPVVTQLPAPIDAILPARFEFNVRAPHADARDLATAAARCAGVDITLTGHADGLGDARVNEEIALARAAAVRALMVAGGLDRARLHIASAGATQPSASNASARGRRDNRRVTLHCEPHNGGEP
jgi:outer membrane protein OmpA-like peptidoglycan-associated protein